MASNNVGGLTCENRGSIMDCFCDTTITGYYRVGGLAGRNIGTITNSVSTSVIKHSGANNLATSEIGGLVGSQGFGSVLNSFWNKEISSITRSGGGVGKTTAQMQDPNLYLNAGWDFLGEKKNGVSELWQMPSDGGYPVLGVLHGYVPPALQGAGLPDDPYLITTPEELGAVRYHPGGSYRLDADIDLSGMGWSSALIPAFAGTFDGQGHRIGNLSINGGAYLGLFGRLSHAVVTNLGLDAVNIVSSGSYIGGLAGHNYLGMVANCYSTGSIGQYASYAGGLLGYHYYGMLSDSYSTVAISGPSAVGGLVGYNYNGTIENCYSTGAVSGEINAGGLVGGKYYGATLNSFWDIDTSGMEESNGGRGMGTIYMKNPNTYINAGWDLDSIWSVLSGHYPRLQWEL